MVCVKAPLPGFQRPGGGEPDKGPGILLSQRRDPGQAGGAPPLPQDPAEEFPVDLFRSAGGHVGPGDPPIGPPAGEYPAETHPPGKIQIENDIRPGKALLRADAEIIPVQDPAPGVRGQEGGSLFPLFLPADLHPAGAELDGIKMQDREGIARSQLPGERGFPAAGMTQNGDLRGVSPLSPGKKAAAGFPAAARLAQVSSCDIWRRRGCR